MTGLTLQADFGAMISKWDRDTEEFKKNSGTVLDKAAQTFLEAVEDMSGELVDPWKGLYEGSFRMNILDEVAVITNDARNVYPYGKDFSYGWIIEWGMDVERMIPLVRDGQVTSLGRWAIGKLGFVEHTTKFGNLYLRTPDGKFLTRMSVKPPARHPMREGYYEGQKRVQKNLPEWLGLEKA